MVVPCQSRTMVLAEKLAHSSPTLLRPAASRQFFPAEFCHCPATSLRRIPVFLYSTKPNLYQHGSLSKTAVQGYGIFSTRCFWYIPFQYSFLVLLQCIRCSFQNTMQLVHWRVYSVQITNGTMDISVQRHRGFLHLSEANGY